MHHGRLTVDFRQVTIDHVRVFRHQELTTNRESGIAFRFRDIGFLQQFQRSATSTNKDKLRLDVVFRFAVFQIGNRDGPAIIRVTLKPTHFGAQLQSKIRFFLQRCNQLARNFAVVYVSTNLSTRCRNFLFWIAAFHDQRRPLFNLRVIFGVTHATEQRTLLQCGITGTQEIHVLVAPDKAHMWHGGDKRAGFMHHAIVDLIRPELAGNLEGFVNFDCLFNADTTVGFFRRVIQFHECRVSRSSIVPAVRTLLSNAIQSLNHGH